MTRGNAPHEGEKGGNTTRHRPYPNTALKDAPRLTETRDVGHTVGSTPARAPRTPSPAQTDRNRQDDADRPEDDTMEDEPSAQPIGDPQGGGGEAEPREMTLLDMALRQAAEILKTISIHAEYPPHIKMLTESIAQRILPKTQAPAATTTADDGKNDILKNIVNTME